MGDQKGCRQIIRGFTFDSDSNLCKKFMEGGCSMTNNGFRKKEDCEAKCITSNVKPKKNPNQPCQGPPATRSCRTRLRRISGFTFDTDSNLCEKFNMTGSCVTKNYFRTKEDCEAKCSTINVKQSCNPDFVDDLEENCADYKINELCTSTGDYGPGWEFNEDGSPADTFEEYAVNGQTALVCPECGCGRGN